MSQAHLTSKLPLSLSGYIAAVSLGGAAWLASLVYGLDWGSAALGDMALFIALIVVAGCFPIPVTSKIKTDVTTAVLFGAALVLEPELAALAGTIGILVYTGIIRFWGPKLRLPWYKYPFNGAQAALSTGAASMVFHALAPESGVLGGGVAAAAGSMFLVNTALVSCAASLQLRISPMRIWWEGTKENGPAELAQLAFGFLGALVYRESAWTVVALLIPVAIIYIAFSRLARLNTQLQLAMEKLEAMQGRIVSTSKLASVGAISLDLAHQIKNPLAILLGRLEPLHDKMEPGSRPRAHLEAAMDAGWRIDELVRTFASIGERKWVHLGVAQLLDEALGVASIRIHKQIETVRDYADDLSARGNPILIREAFANILSNAMEALPDEGGVIKVDAVGVNGSIVVRVTDNGTGIDAKTMEHLFEPFNTSKSNGDGIGLFAAKHILEMHQGAVEIASQEREGTCVTMRLPAVEHRNRAEEHPEPVAQQVEAVPGPGDNNDSPPEES